MSVLPRKNSRVRHVVVTFASTATRWDHSDTLRCQRGTVLPNVGQHSPEPRQERFVAVFDAGSSPSSFRNEPDSSA
jgi:hypothetical protein